MMMKSYSNENLKSLKPPLGVKPQCIYQEERILDLSRAIYNYTNHGSLKNNILIIRKWTKELHDLVNNINYDDSFVNKTF